LFDESHAESCRSLPITPGHDDFDCFQTEFGPIGCAICFDLNYQNIITRIQSQGCKLIIFPTMFQGIFLMRTWAQLHSLYFVSSANELHSTAVDPLGRVMIQPWEHDRIMQLTINLDYIILHTDHNEEKLRAARYAYPGQVDIDVTYLEGGIIFSSGHPTKTAGEIAKEFNIETAQEYLQRSRQKCLDRFKS
jgi:predicted amidohydrolase